jgi:hypothetical protein
LGKTFALLGYENKSSDGGGKKNEAKRGVKTEGGGATDFGGGRRRGVGQGGVLDRVLFVNRSVRRAM